MNNNLTKIMEPTDDVFTHTASVHINRRGVVKLVDGIKITFFAAELLKKDPKYVFEGCAILDPSKGHYLKMMGMYRLKIVAMFDEVKWDLGVVVKGVSNTLSR